MVKELRLILGDQLNHRHSWFKEVNDEVVYAMFEMRQETDYVVHHVQKVVGFFAAMRTFASELQQAGHKVIYYKISAGENEHTLIGNLNKVLATWPEVELVQYQLPDEYRLDKQLKEWEAAIPLNVVAVDTEHFLSGRNDVARMFETRKQVLMETFYREMRRRYNILMEGAQPIGGKWNYDGENRNKWKGTPPAPSQGWLCNNVSSIYKEVLRSNINTIGHIDAANYTWPVNRSQALDILHNFLEQCLPYFGVFQDAMSVHSIYLFHSRLSFALNIKLLSPLEVVQAAIRQWQKKPGLISLPQVEGFVRQIIGWREYMRGIYWWKMPDYAQLNYFGNTRKLPQFFWDGNTQMACMKHSIDASLKHAYAHHIQRLMITGNFMLLAGIHPDEADRWYLGIYIDALQWVEITNTRGMSQFADGGIVGSKPYVSTANYIDKMSDYCHGCYYNKQKRYGERACPFNSLYWDFYERNRVLLAKNPRIGMMYKLLDKVTADEKSAILQQAAYYQSHLETL